METAPTNIGSFILSDSKIRGGKPYIAGTGVTVQRIVEWYKRGESPEGIAENIFGHLSLAQVFAALTYYHANRKEIEDNITQDMLLAHQIEKNWQEQQKQ